MSEPVKWLEPIRVTCFGYFEVEVLFCVLRDGYRSEHGLYRRGDTVCLQFPNAFMFGDCSGDYERWASRWRRWLEKASATDHEFSESLPA